MKILLVESNPTHAQAMRYMILSETLHEVVIASNTLNALKALQQGDFDLVVTAWSGMDGINAIALLSEIRKMDALEHVPVLVATERATAEDVLEAMESGADDIVIKPLNAKTLAAKVERLLSRGPRRVEGS